MPNICVQTKKSFLEIYLRQPTPLLVLVLLFGPHLGSAAPPTTAIKQPQGTVAGYQSADDCNSNYVLDEIEHMNGQLFIEPLQGLSGLYGGIIGTSHSSHYDFSDEFLFVRSVWLRLRGTADQSTGNPVNLQFSVRVDGVALASTSLSNLNEYEVCIPLPTTTPLAATMSMTILIGVCCDHISHLENATLWFDAVPLPPPQHLANFAEFQNCFHSETDSVYCEASNIDRDGDVDLAGH